MVVNFELREVLYVQKGKEIESEWKGQGLEQADLEVFGGKYQRILCVIALVIFLAHCDLGTLIQQLQEPI